MMKKFALLIITAVVSVLSLAAQTDQDYFLDFQGDNQHWWFSWDASKECYTMTLPKLDKNFKIYSAKYVQGGSNQDQYIYGASENGESGIIAGVDRTLQHPGKDMQAQDGVVMYNVQFEFWPDRMLLRCVAGTRTPELGIAMSPQPTSTNSGKVDFTIAPPEHAAAGQEYTVTITYKDKDGVTQTQTITTADTSGSFDLENLTEGGKTDIKLDVTTTVDGNAIESSTTGSLTTYMTPILVGQIKDHVWTSDYGIYGTPIEDYPGNYQFIVEFTGEGEFSFVTKLGDSWDVVDTSVRYSPSSNRVTAPFNTWNDYQEFNAGTTNAWKVEDFDSSKPVYIVYFSYPRKQVMVEGAYVTGVENVDADSAVHTGNVYSISGVLVRTGASSTDGLAPGIYIVDGAKVLVK